MNEKIKQRIVGIVVMTALLAIFLPMLFEDPVERSGRSISEMQIPELPEEFQESQLPVVPSSTEQVIQEPAVTSNSLEKPQPKPISPTQPVANKPAEKTKPVSKLVVNKPARNLEKPKTEVKKLIRWVIQVGSFKSKANAEAERDKLRKQGFVAFVESYNNMFRVRVGPELDKAKAKQNQQLLESKNKVKTLLVSE